MCFYLHVLKKILKDYFKNLNLYFFSKFIMILHIFQQSVTDNVFIKYSLMHKKNNTVFKNNFQMILKYQFDKVFKAMLILKVKNLFRHHFIPESNFGNAKTSLIENILISYFSSFSQIFSFRIKSYFLKERFRKSKQKVARKI